MGYYLSKENRETIQLILRLLKDQKGSVKLDIGDVDRIIYLVRTGANTEFPELKAWIFKRKETHVLAIPRSINIPTIVENIPIYDVECRLVDIANKIINEKFEKLKFTNAFLTETELARLQEFCQKLGYTTSKSDTDLTIRRNENG